ncbi:MAG: diadenylate cyclase, partial [Isosphaeraceae bacterium]
MDLGEITRLTPLDLLDVLIISYVILRFLLLFRGTATLQVLIGLGFLRVMLIFARASNLVMTSWLLEGINAVAVLVIVVVFRNEIREVLLQSNPARLLIGRPEKARAVDLPVVAEAAFRLAATRTGALLVFPNRDKLGEHVREGVALGGQFSGAVLESLFARTSPVHDGAAVIRGGRIDRVGAILPLSTRSGLPPEFGTRHRAAVGLSEVCDAIVVIVSEERGEVSIAQRGLVEPVEDAQALERLLRHRLLGHVDGKRSTGWTAELIRQVGGYLAVFLLVSASVVTWRAYFGERVSVKNLNVPINFRNVPAGLDLQNTTSDEVTVQVGGQGPLFNALSPDQVVAS